MAKGQKRKCTATVQSGPKKGKRCGAWALRGHLVCLSHADQKTRESVRFGGAQEGAGRPRKVKPMELEKRLLENYAIAWMQPYWRILGFEIEIDAEGELQLTERPEGGAKIYGESKDGDINMTGHDDLGAQMAAAEKLRDRVFGRPQSRSEFSGKVEHRHVEKLDDAITREIQRLTEELADRDADREPAR